MRDLRLYSEQRVSAYSNWHFTLGPAIQAAHIAASREEVRVTKRGHILNLTRPGEACMADLQTQRPKGTASEQNNSSLKGVVAGSRTLCLQLPNKGQSPPYLSLSIVF